MSNIPDFAMQVQEVQRQIEAQSDVTAQDWKDAVQQRYYDNYMNAYKEKMELYIHGGSGISGKGINDLLVFLDEQMQKMEQLTGVPADLTFMCAAGASYTGSVRDNYGVSIPVEEKEMVSCIMKKGNATIGEKKEPSLNRITVRVLVNTQMRRLSR